MINFPKFLLILAPVMSISCGQQPQQQNMTEKNRTRVPVAADVKDSIFRGDEITKSSDKTQSSPRQDSDALDTLAGQLAVTGAEPFIHLTLTIQNSRDVFLTGDTTLINPLWKLQGKNIRVIGTKKITPMGDELHIKEYSIQ